MKVKNAFKNLFGIKTILTAFLIFSMFSDLLPTQNSIYELSFKMTGNAKGHILLIFPYRVFYSSDASLLFKTYENDKETRFELIDVPKTGRLVRTIGFSGRSLAVLTADNNITKGETLYKNIIDNFETTAPKYSKFIKKTYWNNYSFTKIKRGITFIRTKRGINKDLKYDFWLKRSPTKKKLKTSFNIYRILSEIIKAYNHSFLPPNRDLSEIIGSHVSWMSEEIDFSETLKKSTRHAASIFKKIKPLKQKKPFRVKYNLTENRKGIITIKGESKPEIAVWGSFKIMYFSRTVKIRINDKKLISDKMIIEIYNKSGKGGTFFASILLKN